MNTMENIENYFKMELSDAERLATMINKGEVRWTTLKKVIDGTLHRMLGVCFFVQASNDKISFDEIDAVYNHYRALIEALNKKGDKNE